MNGVGHGGACSTGERGGKAARACSALRQGCSLAKLRADGCFRCLRRGKQANVVQREKLLEAIRRNPRDVGFDDALKVARLLGFVHSGGKGSHRAYSRPGEAMVLNFQNRNGKIPPYQARQLIQMIDKYGDIL